MTNKNIRIDSRLSLAASFVRRGGVAADIGTDHAYIPIYLLENGISPYAIASDINEGPLSRAKENAKLHGVYDKIYFGLTDGLDGLPLSEKEVCDIVICGMGGELIARIVDDCSYALREGVNLILQPMSSIGELRYYLAKKGFKTLDEGICKSQGKIYQCINCTYTGEPCTLTEAEALIGKVNIERGRENPLFEELITNLINRTKFIIVGKEKGSGDAMSDKMLLAELEEIYNRRG